jgi:transposase
MPTRSPGAMASSCEPRGKNGGVIGCAMANRANKIAYAMVRDQSGYDPDRWA